LSHKERPTRSSGYGHHAKPRKHGMGLFGSGSLTAGMQECAAEATGEWLLFTDADVVFCADCAERALRYALDKGLDHLTLPPEIVCRGVFLRSFVAAFTLVFEMTQRPWRAGDPGPGSTWASGPSTSSSKKPTRRSGPTTPSACDPTTT
jgi:hypothetical protein